MFELPCQHVSALMSEYAEDDLGPVRRRRVGRHLRRCERCRAVYRSLLRTIGALRALAEHQPPARPELADVVVRRIEAER